MRTILVHRKGYRRKGYRRKAYTYVRNGKRIHVRATYVKPTFIGPTTYRMVDKGEPGKTPKAERWFFPKKKLDGWKKTLPARERKKILDRVVRRDGYATTIRRLNALRNVTTDIETKRACEADMRYLRRRYIGYTA